MRDASRRDSRLASRVIGTVAAALLVHGSFGANPARAQETDEDTSPYSELSLGAAVTTLRPGEPVTVALRLVLDVGWHTYWVNGGDAGLPFEVFWSVPDGFSVGPLQWPSPQLIPTPPFMSYAYEHELVLLAEVTPPADLAPGTGIEVTAAADWLVCDVECLPATGTVTLTLPVSGERASVDDPWAGVIETARQRLPRRAEGWSTRAWSTERGYVIEIIPARGDPLPAPYFFVDDVGVVEHAAPQRVARDGNTVRMLVPRSEFAAEDPPALHGLLTADARAVQGMAWTVDFVLDQAAGTSVPGGLLAADAQRTGGFEEPGSGGLATVEAGASATGLGIALLLALLGGLALNLMPCVLPVLAVKVLGFVQQGGMDPRSARRHGLAYGGGVLVSLWLLAGVLIGLRAAGQALGWGFQLQSPSIVALLALLVFALALNLAGVFEIGLSLTRLGAAGEGGGYRGSFLTGGLAVLVATPCTAPFMGAALGYALVQPPLAGFSVFTALAVGLAAPYVLLASAPGLLRRLPRPGPWMATFRELLAFPMFAAAVWLIWVFGRQVGIDAVAILLMGFALLGFAAWLVGRPGTYASRRVQLAAGGVACLALIAGLAAARAPATEGLGDPASSVDWEVFSPTRVAELRGLGRPVFVNFTAAWCLTCQVNDRVALSTRAVRTAFAAADVALVKADWTNRDPVIAEALRALGRGGLPLYVLYPSGGGDPEILPALLSAGLVVAAVDRAAPGEFVASTIGR